MGDQTFLLKYRLLSANQENGNYIVTAFMASAHRPAMTGTALGTGSLPPPPSRRARGFGDFNVQSTLGITFPSGDDDRLGWPVVWNTAFQYHIFKYFWPEVETNYTWFAKGERTGQNQLFLTPTLLLGRFSIHGRLGLTFGAGFHVAVTKGRAYNHAVILSLRAPF